MRYQLFVSAIVLASSLFLNGCLSMGSGRRKSGDSDLEGSYMSNLYLKESREEAAQMSLNLKFDDIPIPAGFEFDHKESFIFKNGLTRVGVVRYIGQADLSAVTTFFKNQMPTYNWNLVNSIEYKRSIINFDKDAQTATIIIELQGSRVFLTVASGPIGQ